MSLDCKCTITDIYCKIKNLLIFFYFQITIINPNYFTILSEYGGELQYALYNIPNTLSSIINKIQTSRLGISKNSILLKMGQNGLSYTDILDLPSHMQCFSFGCWVGMADSSQKNLILSHRGHRPFSVQEMSGLYSVLTEQTAFGATKSEISDVLFYQECELFLQVPNNTTYHISITSHSCLFIH